MELNFSQTRAPLFEELLKYCRQPLISFHTPGHKAGRGLAAQWKRLKFPSSFDLTEISSWDWAGSLEKAEVLAAEFYKSDYAFFLTQGASQGNIGGILGAFSPGDKVLIGRNCHTSIIHGLILADLDPLYIETRFLTEWNISIGIHPDALKNKIEEAPHFKGLIITNPSYQGIAGGLESFRKMIGNRILFVDEAHGGHFDWMGFPGYDAFNTADIWVQGTHKIFGSFTQTGILHLKGNRVNRAYLKCGLDLVTTTSPSYILLASLDSNRCWLALRGSQLFRTNLPLIQEFCQKITGLPGIKVFSGAVLAVNDPNQVVDPWKLSIQFGELGLTGYQAETILRKKYGIQAEYADLTQVVFFIAPWQAKKDLRKLEAALRELSGSKIVQGKVMGQGPPSSIPPLVMRPRDAWMGPAMEVPLEQAAGRISAAVISPYPPGIPLIAPGELIRPDEIQYIQAILKDQGLVRGLNPDGTIRVNSF